MHGNKFPFENVSSEVPNKFFSHYTAVEMILYSFFLYIFLVLFCFRMWKSRFSPHLPLTSDIWRGGVGGGTVSWTCWAGEGDWTMFICSVSAAQTLASLDQRYSMYITHLDIGAAPYTVLCTDCVVLKIWERRCILWSTNFWSTECILLFLSATLRNCGRLN
jgi:hypothetical protein